MRAEGSSPRVWGQANGGYTQLWLAGDHPHAYGDKKTVKAYTHICLGSSPRVWGQVSFVNCLFKLLRIIPTRMGTRKQSMRKLVCPWDHPHAYGDKGRSTTLLYYLIGSSPRVWGQVTFDFPFMSCIRIIPTRMGTSNKADTRNGKMGDHPHAYGDKTKEIKENSGFAKSTA